MKGSTKLVLFAIFIVIVLIIVFRLAGDASADSGKYDVFAQCLSDSGVKMFGAYWCPHCQSQKKMFGDSWGNVNYIECSLPNRAGQTPLCTSEGIMSYPTWEFADGSRVNNVMTLGDLSIRSGCALPE